ncbi:hypothetical protein B0A50_07363 [Salinomyces thailandicus]|uniref:NAD(P)-binding protein n=1 Tax=Salinomyces thailandicus TaxID=706561 RepID=A0A4U0TME6_9PEZI|nr:hypothetical protein B0A50_07363 [Salinomyces thailandica]
MPPTHPPKTAYITGAASGIGLALATHLFARGYVLALADLNHTSLQTHASHLHTTSPTHTPPNIYALDASSWSSQSSVFTQAVANLGGRVDYVFAIAGVGEKRSLPNFGAEATGEFVKPDGVCLDVDLYGVVWTVSLGVQQMRRQAKDGEGWRGKIAVTASVCGFYCVPTLPLYTAAKHGVIGLTRSYGTYLPEEFITLNAVCPNVVRTNISSSDFYEKMEAAGLLTPMSSVIEAFERFIDGGMSGQCLEAGPKGNLVVRAPAEYLDRETEEIMGMLYERAHALHEPVT